jgi:hypothetical protein
VAITINTNEISGASQSFQMVAMSSDLSGTLLARSQTVNINPPPSIPEQGGFTLWGSRCNYALGEVQTAKIRARASGTAVWGSNPYTDDSDWSVAVVHAGLAVPGELVDIRFESLGDASDFPGTTANGVTTSPYAPTWCAVQISKIV